VDIEILLWKVLSLFCAMCSMLIVCKYCCDWTVSFTVTIRNDSRLMWDHRQFSPFVNLALNLIKTSISDVNLIKPFALNRATLTTCQLMLNNDYKIVLFYYTPISLVLHPAKHW